MMTQSKMRSLKTVKTRKSLRKSKVKKLSFKATSSRRNARPSMRSGVKGRMRRSPMRAQVPTAVKRMSQKKKSIKYKKPKGNTPKINLIDASPGEKGKKPIGTNVVFFAKDSARKSDIRMAKPPVFSTMKISRLTSRLMNQGSRAREGVDFFCNLGQRVHQSKPVVKQKRLRDGEQGVTKRIVGCRPMAGRLEAVRLEAGRLKAGGLGAAVAKVNGLLAGGPKVGIKRGIDLAEIPRGTELTRAVGIGSLCPGPVLNSSASMAAKDVVVPLTNRLPIIDFISTNEFNKMTKTQKSPRRRNR
ncbi:uncharacterized protein LOC110191971 [Drosophila serrata]|uniref:uncharacterized protein LOC110191971 n=1 Tax=Drosophila serrata TaxID=7274 RepID=UPI000A1D029B|nr:uncharacterized protein LOC110191971 [Drosophila serrata]